MKKKSCIIMCFIFITLSLGFGVALADGPSYRYENATLQDGYIEPFTMMAYQVNGASWWDRCEGMFYFYREYFGLATGNEMNALLSTLPTCTLTKVSNGSLLSQVSFDNYTTRVFHYTDSMCWMTYGVKLHVSIPEYGGEQNYDLYDYDD